MKALKKLLNGVALLLLFADDTPAQVSEKDSPINDSQKTVIIQKAISLLREHYVFPERVSNIESCLSEANHRHSDALTLFSFLERFNTDLERCGNDKHLDIFYGPQIVAKLRRADTVQTSSSAPLEYLQMLAYENYLVRKVERLDGNIGYLKLNGFIELEHSKEVLSSAMHFIAHSNAIILDLRENGGGSAATTNYLMSYFLPDSTLLGEFRSKRSGVIKLYTSRTSSMPHLDMCKRRLN